MTDEEIAPDMGYDWHSEDLVSGLGRCLIGGNRMAGLVRHLLGPFVAKKPTAEGLPQHQSPAMKEGGE